MSNWVVGHLGNTAVNLDSGMVVEVGGSGETDDSETWKVEARSLHGMMYGPGDFKVIHSGLTLAEARLFIQQLARINSVYYTEADHWLNSLRGKDIEPVREWPITGPGSGSGALKK